MESVKKREVRHGGFLDSRVSDLSIPKDGTKGKSYVY